MLCYRCGSHVADTVDTCPTCGQKLAGGGLRQATGTFSRRRATSQILEGAPYKAQDLVANRYLIKDVVGGGPLGFVFRAHDKEVDVEVALKVINARLCQTADERRGFAKQLRSARKLSHPNLARVYEEGEDQDRPFFTSQFLDGLTLRKIIDLRLQKGQFFALHEIEPILSQVCSALDGAHKVGPHTDLKPDNVLVLPDLLKVTDFGLGLALPRLPFVQALKSRKAERYLAPELVDGGEVDGRCDVYSVGVILGEMLSGLTPDGSTPELHRRNPNVPQALEGLYRKAVNANPNARFKTAGELMGELSAISRSSAPPPVPARPEPAAGVPPPLRPRTTSGMLQLSPRRDKPSPPVPSLPSMPIPPPPPVPGSSSEESIPVDATQPVDSSRLEAALQAAGPTPEPAENREETAVMDSQQIIASLDPDDHAETHARLEAVPPPPEPAVVDSGFDGKTWIFVLVLVVLGLGVGAGGGFVLFQRQKAAAEEARKREEDALQRQKAEEEERRRQEEIEKAALANEPPKAEPGTPPAVVPAELTAEEKAAQEKLALDKAADEKAAQEKLAAEKAALEKAEKDKLKGAFDKAAADKAEEERLAREKAEQEKAAKTEQDKAAKAAKAAADKEAAEKAAAEKAAKAAADKEAAEKEKAEKAKLAASANSGNPTKTSNAGDSCPDGMRLVSAGVFRMGTPRDDPMMGFDERVLSAVEVPAFCIDTFEYPNKRGVAPTASVGFADAKRLCESQNKRLCSESEWEKSCKGNGGAKWPFGNNFDANACNTEDDSGEARSLATSGKFGKCRSGLGVADMAGNVSEWTSDKIIKGGSFASGDYAVRCSARKNGASFNKSSEVGFRCCADTK